MCFSMYNQNNSAEERCSYKRYDCRGHNPCDPKPCEEGVTSYPGQRRDKYVTCTAGQCEEAQCEPGSVWEEDSRGCILKPAGNYIL